MCIVVLMGMGEIFDDVMGNGVAVMTSLLLLFY